ncbi:hypothetical protein [uncultured Algibacter sp.]|uniref:hypothetical protein n=1 Tax=uncultured Algibacter sp. TaxID=298659 RepID=UPI0026243624|nr:hypothetical protein [uncultured Algibacter sp.]
MKTKKYLIAFALAGGLLFTTFTTETISQDEAKTKVDRKTRKILADTKADAKVDRKTRKILACTKVDRKTRKILA